MKSKGINQNQIMDLKTKSPITFSITGILSTGTTSKKHETTSRPSFHPMESTFTRSSAVKRESSECFYEGDEDRYNGYKKYLSENDSLYARHYLAYRRRESDQSSEILDDYRSRVLDSPSPPKIFCTNNATPCNSPPSTVYYTSSPYSTNREIASINHETVMTSAQNGRFRPPPFFETVLSLRKRLYQLGGKNFSVDEPPSDRNVHKLWRSMEKRKVNYSLQHYFYVASLSNRCFDLVERIHYKVSRGLLEGSRDKEVNQSYFNFLYGKTEEERFELLKLLERGEISPKTISKTSSKRTNDNCKSKCHNCKEEIQKVENEKNIVERKFEKLKRKYDKMVADSLSFYSKDGRTCMRKSNSV